LDNLTLPSLDDWREFKVYPPTSKVENSDGLGFEGTKTFEQVVVPQNTEIKEIPALAFSYFNPDQRTYRMLRRAPIPLIVRPSATMQPLAMVATNQAGGDSPPPVQQDIVYLKTHLGAVSLPTTPLLYQPWFQVVQLLPVLAWFTAFGWRKRREHLANNPRLVRRQRVASLLRDGLGELRRLAAAQYADEFFAVVFRLLQEQLGERLDLPAAAITEAVVDEQLQPRGVPAELLGELHTLFQACNQARYAPASSTHELMGLLPRIEAALKALQKLDLV
jgi:hypothetical protein